MVVLALLTLFGIGASPDPGLWAFTIVGAAGLAVLATALNLRRHGQPWPLLLSGLAALVIGYVMLGAYDPLIEALAFAALLGAVALDLYLIHRAALCP